jgi:hypothetical protein
MVSATELLPKPLVAVTVKADAPIAVGVPPIAPLALFKLNPAGSVPLVTAHEMGLLPPAANVKEYALPTKPAGSEDRVVIVGGAFTPRLNCLEPLPIALVAVAVKVATPTATGVPLRSPVDGFRARPPGSAPLLMLHVIGVLPEAMRVCE